MRCLSKAALPLSIVAGLIATPADAQWTGPGEWGQDSYVQFVEPGTWMTVFADVAGQRVIRSTA